MPAAHPARAATRPRCGDRTRALQGASKPWKVAVPMPEWSLNECIRVSLWWNGLLALPVLDAFSPLTTQSLDSTAAGGPGTFLSQEQDASVVLADRRSCHHSL